MLTQLKTLYGGLFLVLALSLSSLYLAQMPIFQSIHISSLTLAIIIGMIYGNTVHHSTPPAWFSGITYSQKKLLRLGIILYGFRITFQQIFNIGIMSLLFDILVVVSISTTGYFLGVKVFKLNPKTSLLVASGSSICGAAAVLAVEATIKPRPHETAIAIATVVIFGTIAMFVYPYIVSFIGLNPHQMGVALGGTVHEVAQVVAAGSMISPEVESTAVIVKLCRVMLLVPFLVILGYILSKIKTADTSQEKVSLMAVFPWFAIGFVAVSGFNSLNILPTGVVEWFVGFDNLVLTMAMTALGIESNFKKMKQVGFAPFILAGVLFIILIGFLYIPKYI